MSQLLLAKKCCGQCLTTRNRIVSGRRAAEIIRGCRTRGTHFRCHKGDIAGLIVHCRGVHDICRGSQAHQFAQRLGIPVIEVDADALQSSLEDRS